MSESHQPAQTSPALRRLRSFAYYWCARTATNGAYQMQVVAVGWQVYDLTNDPFDLGLVGLVQFIPILLFSLAIGQVADRYDRRAVARLCQIVKAIAAAALAFGTFGGWLGRDAILAVLFVTGVARAFDTPTMHALVPGLVPTQLLPRAIAAAATATQTAVICGPAIGGAIYYVAGPVAVYATCAATFFAAAVLLGLLRLNLATPDRRPITLKTLLAGFDYIRRRPILLGALSLDLLTVLLGSVAALLPIFARDVLQAGESGPLVLGMLRSAPAIGALAMSAVLSWFSLDRNLGRTLFLSVAVYGGSVVVFAMSSWLALSLIALAIYGAADAVSVVIRHSLVQLHTPNEMLGRVMAINSLFTGSSGTLGEFRAGTVAALLGGVAAALIGGIGALAVALLWMRLFPSLYRVDSLPEKRG
ncbi:MAG TPA: MFS transporter [Xanthobacteraceae bacterium]|nr:MFS transporter [Xanthobacteraceae bacterium]